MEIVQSSPQSGLGFLKTISVEVSVSRCCTLCSSVLADADGALTLARGVMANLMVT